MIRGGGHMSVLIVRLVRKSVEQVLFECASYVS